MKLSEAIAVKVGTTDASAVYVGETKVWPATPSAAYWDATVKNAGITLSGTGSSIATSSAAGWKSVRGVMGNSSGKRYLEFKNLTGGVMVMAGLCDATPNLGGYGGSDAHGWTDYGSNGNVYHSGANKACLPTGWITAAGYVLRVFHDPATGSIWFGLGGSGVAGGSLWAGDPEAGTGAAYTGVFGTLYPCGSPNTVGAALGLRVKASEYEYAIPAGGSSWSGE